MNIHLARHYGMCFGVRDALRSTHDLAAERKLTVLGELVHNPVVQEHLGRLGVRNGSLSDMESAQTKDVVITAHGAADRDRKRWADAGFRVSDTTCPLVKKAHNALAQLVARGFYPVVIGKRDHVEVRGLVGDFPEAAVVETFRDIVRLPRGKNLGVVSQTTQPIDQVKRMVGQIERCHPTVEVEFKDTVCQPTKDRQRALEDLCAENEVVIVVGGANSNNTAQLARTAEKLGARAYHVARAEEVDPRWLRRVENVGVTAGTSTLDESVQQVFARLKEIAAAQADTIGKRLKTLAGV
ncbi:MAG: 4-hydroxy-3-methylbut-2-enyl diphosphate reductase [Pseudoalteromonas tetraodonis]|jgi:4-hydroxy-3-methylbut-2-enyl diphosphate reductase